MAYNEFPRKGYGRIFVEKEEDIEKVKDIIRKMDEFEFEYLEFRTDEILRLIKRQGGSITK